MWPHWLRLSPVTITFICEGERFALSPQEAACITASLVGRRTVSIELSVPQNITLSTFRYLVTFCKRYQQKSMKEIMTWLETSCSPLELCAVLEAGNYFAMETLLEACGRVLASLLAGKSPESIRRMFQITNDLHD